VKLHFAYRIITVYDQPFHTVPLYIFTKYRAMPAFDEANRINAYNQYLRLEQEGGE
jgi:hypothetical protein